MVKRDKLKLPNSASELAKRKKCPTIKCKEQLLRKYPVGVDVSVEDPDSIEVHK